MKIITARNMQELETAINATAGLDCNKVSMISDGNCYAVMGDTTKPALNVTANGTYNQGPYGIVTVAVTPTLQDKTVSIATLVSGGTITCDEGYDGLGTITLEE